MGMATDLNPAQMAILQKVAESQEDITAYQIAVDLKKEPAAVSRSVQHLEENGLLNVEKAKKGNAKLLRLTMKGGYAYLGMGIINPELFYERKKDLHKPFFVEWLPKIIPKADDIRKNISIEIAKYIYSSGLLDTAPDELEGLTGTRWIIGLFMGTILRVMHVRNENPSVVDNKAFMEFVKYTEKANKTFFDEVRKQLS